MSLFIVIINYSYLSLYVLLIRGRLDGSSMGGSTNSTPGSSSTGNRSFSNSVMGSGQAIQ